MCVLTRIASISYFVFLSRIQMLFTDNIETLWIHHFLLLCKFYKLNAASVCTLTKSIYK